MKFKDLCRRIKATDDFNVLSVGEIKGWLSTILPTKECNEEVIKTLEKSKKSLSLLNCRMPEYWNDSVGELEVLDLINEIQATIRALEVE